LTGAGKHSVMGELIGKTVRAAVLETLKLQNSLTQESCRSAVYHLRRFGVDILIYESFPRIAARAVALGFSEKWVEPDD